MLTDLQLTPADSTYLFKDGVLPLFLSLLLEQLHPGNEKVPIHTIVQITPMQLMWDNQKQHLGNPNAKTFSENNTMKTLLFFCQILFPIKKNDFTKLHDFQDV